MKEILNNEFASVFYDETGNSIITVWKKPATTESYQAIFSIILHKIIEYGCDSYISDIFYQGLVATENRLWLQNEIIPKAYKAGLRKVAIIAPSDVFSRFYVESVKTGAAIETLDIDFRYFQDLISAQAWMINEEVPV